MVVVLNDLALNVSRKDSKKLSVVSRGNKSIVSTSEKKHINSGEVGLEVVGVIHGRIVLTIDSLIGGSGAVVEGLEVARAHHLSPVHQVLGGGATNVVAAHHGKHAQVKVVGLVEADDGLDEVPDEAREIMEEGSGPVGNAWNVEETIDLVVGKIGDLKEVQDGGEDTVLVVNIHHWSQSNEGFKVLSEISVKGIGDEPLSCALRVTEPNNLREVALLVSQNVFDMSGNIESGHITHGEIPELLIISSVIKMLV